MKAQKMRFFMCGSLLCVFSYLMQHQMVYSSENLLSPSTEPVDDNTESENHNKYTTIIEELADNYVDNNTSATFLSGRKSGENSNTSTDKTKNTSIHTSNEKKKEESKEFENNYADSEGTKRQSYRQELVKEEDDTLNDEKDDDTLNDEKDDTWNDEEDDTLNDEEELKKDHVHHGIVEEETQINNNELEEENGDDDIIKREGKAHSENVSHHGEEDHSVSVVVVEEPAATAISSEGDLAEKENTVQLSEASRRSDHKNNDEVQETIVVKPQESDDEHKSGKCRRFCTDAWKGTVKRFGLLYDSMRRHLEHAVKRWCLRSRFVRKILLEVVQDKKIDSGLDSNINAILDDSYLRDHAYHLGKRYKLLKDEKNAIMIYARRELIKTTSPLFQLAAGDEDLTAAITAFKKSAKYYRLAKEKTLKELLDLQNQLIYMFIHGAIQFD